VPADPEETVPPWGIRTASNPPRPAAPKRNGRPDTDPVLLLKDGPGHTGATVPPFDSKSPVEPKRTRTSLFTPLSRRNARRSVVVEFNPNQILAAEISRPYRGAAIIESAAEFDREDTVGLGRWIEAGVDAKKSWLPTICGVVPARGIVHRETLQLHRLEEPDYIAGVIEHQQKGRVLTATPFKVITPDAWTLRAVGAVDGNTLTDDGPARPALICGVTNDELLRVHQRLLNDRLLAERVEPSLLPLFGTIYGYMERNQDTRAVVIAVIHARATAVYILGKEGVHTPNPVLHGFESIVETARKELGVLDEADVRRRMCSGGPALAEHAAKLVRKIGRDLKPVIDSYEMTTGQPVEEIFCPYLSPGLAWIAEPLARSAGRTPMLVNCEEWLPYANLQRGEGVGIFAPHWLGALSLAANLPEPATVKSGRQRGEDPAYSRPWHVDCKVAAEPPENLVGRGFLAGAIAAVLLIFIAAVTVWQLYATNAMRTDTRFWERRMAENRQLFDELTTASAQLKTQSAVLKNAYDLMSAPFAHSEFMLNLGRTLPARMRIDHVDSDDTHVSISGALFEPAEEATGTLGRYIEDLRRHRGIGPLFSSIGITSLHRRNENEEVVFVITLRLKGARP
jgi:hypothetical protein